MAERLANTRSLGLYRDRVDLSAPGLINFCSNDYLGIRQHPRILQAFSAGASKYGLGSGSSALIGGYYPVHAELEERFAKFFQRDSAILFNSGYHANIGVITALANRNRRIFVDRFCHASILDAIVLSRAKYRRYAHNNTENLCHFLAKESCQHSLIISESIFSMEGDLAPVAELANIAKKYQSTLIIDDAHGVGVLGHYGKGICEQAGLSQEQVPVLVAPLGKAFGGLGAIVAGSSELIDSLVQFSRTYRYTTALPPAIAYAVLQALQIVATEIWRRERLNELIAFFCREAGQRELPLLSSSQTPIQAILIGDNERVMTIKNQLHSAGIAVAAIRPPTVPVNTARLRISLSCEHTEKQILRLLDLLMENGVGNDQRKY